MIVIEFTTPSWASNFATWLAALAILLLLIGDRLRRRRYNLPPGPKPWPIIGNFNLIGPLPHMSLDALSHKYGPIMHLWLGSTHVVVGSSVDMARAFLKTHDGTVASRPKFAAGKYTAYNFSDITYSPYGPHWRQARSICKRELFTAKRLESFEYIRREEVHSLMNELFNSAAATKTKRSIITLKHYVSAHSLNIVSRMMVGKRFMEKRQDNNNIVSPVEFNEMMDELLLLNGVLNIGDFIPWIDFLDLQGYIKRMKALTNKFDRLWERVLDEHIEERKGMKDNYVAKDIMDVLLDLAEDPTLEVKLGRPEVKAITQDLLVAGTDTSSAVIEWTMSELLRKPEVLKMATEELERVIGTERWVEEKDIVDLPYINAIVKEAMRLHPVAPLLARLAREDFNVDGYDIPKGTIVLVNTWAIGRDPAIWENNPNEFIPERFLGKDIDVIGHDFELLPFGAGRRMCPGYPLGPKVFLANLANLLHGFNWSLPDCMNKEDLSMEESFRLAVIKKLPLEVVVEPRLPNHLYAV